MRSYSEIIIDTLSLAQPESGNEKKTKKYLNGKIFLVSQMLSEKNIKTLASTRALMFKIRSLLYFQVRQTQEIQPPVYFPIPKNYRDCLLGYFFFFFLIPNFLKRLPL